MRHPNRAYDAVRAREANKDTCDARTLAEDIVCSDGLEILYIEKMVMRNPFQTVS